MDQNVYKEEMQGVIQTTKKTEQVREQVIEWHLSSHADATPTVCGSTGTIKRYKTVSHLMVISVGHTSKVPVMLR